MMLDGPNAASMEPSKGAIPSTAVLLPDSLPTLHLRSAPSTHAGGWGSWSPSEALASALAQAILSPTGKRVLAGALRLLHALVSPLLVVLRAARPHRPLPPITEPLLQRSASELAALIRTRKVRSEEVVAAFVERVRAVNPLLNAVVQERFEEALEDARAADAQVASAAADPERSAQLAQQKPLLGVPVTVKESLAVKGLSHTAGQRTLLGRRAEEDAEVVQRLRAAGAIPLLVSNCPELCMHYESYNLVTGRTRNPHDTRRTSGGSSGGEAALLAAGASVIGVASDIAGSSRVPAMFTGVFGHKPTAGVVSDVGHLPVTDDVDWWRFFSVGPMTRYAEDLLPMLKIMSKESALPNLKLEEKVNVPELRIFYIENDGAITSNPVDPDILQGMHKAVNHLKKVCKVEPQKIHIKDLQYALELTVACLFRLEGIQSVFQIGDNPHEWRSVTMEWLKYLVGMSQVSLYSLVYGPLKYIFASLPHDELSRYIETIGKLRKQFEEILKHDGVLLYPTFVQPAAFHGEMYCLFMSGMYCAIFNVLQLPATNCPVGKSKNDLPIGIQIVAARHQDRLSIAVARELETALGGWIKP